MKHSRYQCIWSICISEIRMIFRLPNFGYDIHTTGRWACNMLKWLNYATTFCTQFVLVLFTFDRFMAYIPFEVTTVAEKFEISSCGFDDNYIPLTYILTAGNMYVFDFEDGSVDKHLIFRKLEERFISTTQPRCSFAPYRPRCSLCST